jgi:hypothetical protein
VKALVTGASGFIVRRVAQLDPAQPRSAARLPRERHTDERVQDSVEVSRKDCEVSGAISCSTARDSHVAEFYDGFNSSTSKEPHGMKSPGSVTQ